MKIRKSFVAALLAVLLSLALVFPFGGCKKNPPPPPPPPPPSGKVYFETDTVFYTDIKASVFSSDIEEIKGYIDEIAVTCKTDGKFSMKTTSILGVDDKEVGTYELLENKTILRLYEEGSPDADYELEFLGDGSLKGVKYGEEDGKELVTYIYTNIDNFARFIYPEAILGELIPFENGASFALDLGSRSGSLAYAAASIIEFTEEGSYTMMLVLGQTPLAFSGAYNLVLDENDETILAVKMLIDGGASKDVAEHEIITKTGADDFDYMILIFKTGKVLTSEFYSDANEMPEVGEFPAALGTKNIFSAKKEFGSTVGSFIFRADGKYSFNPNAIGNMMSLPPDVGFYNLNGDGDELTLLSDTHGAYNGDYGLTDVDGQLVFVINTLPFTEIIEPVEVEETYEDDWFSEETTFDIDLTKSAEETCAALGMTAAELFVSGSYIFNADGTFAFDRICNNPAFTVEGASGTYSISNTGKTIKLIFADDSEEVLEFDLANGIILQTIEAVPGVPAFNVSVYYNIVGETYNDDWFNAETTFELGAMGKYVLGLIGMNVDSIDFVFDTDGTFIYTTVLTAMPMMPIIETGTYSISVSGESIKLIWDEDSSEEILAYNSATGVVARTISGTDFTFNIVVETYEDDWFNAETSFELDAMGKMILGFIGMNVDSIDFIFDTNGTFTYTTVLTAMPMMPIVETGTYSISTSGKSIKLIWDEDSAEEILAYNSATGVVVRTISGTDFTFNIVV